MSDVLTPPEGQTSFSGIPTAQFVEDVDSYMKGEDSAEEKLKVHNIYAPPKPINIVSHDTINIKFRLYLNKTLPKADSQNVPNLRDTNKTFLSLKVPKISIIESSPKKGVPLRKYSNTENLS